MNFRIGKIHIWKCLYWYIYNSLKEYNLPLHFKVVIESLNHVFLYIVVINLVSEIISANSCCFKISARHLCTLTLHPVFGYWQRWVNFYLINYTLYIEWLIVLFVSLYSFQRSVISLLTLFFCHSLYSLPLFRICPVWLM